MNFTFRSITTWPGTPTPYGKRQRLTFTTRSHETLKLLDRELRHLCAKNVTLYTYHDETDIRQDGLPKASAKVPSDSGVILSFDSCFGPLSFPCDTFTRWQDNLRAIALTLEYWRTVDRYGVTERGEPYTDWKPLTPANDVLLPEDAAVFISSYSIFAPMDILGIRQTFIAAYKQAAKHLHPDNQETGNEELFKRLAQARAVVEKKFSQT